jgi:hypothetical protein
MKTWILDLDALDDMSILDWMRNAPSTHVRIFGVLLTRAQAIELWRLDADERARRVEEMRKGTARPNLAYPVEIPTGQAEVTTRAETSEIEPVLVPAMGNETAKSCRNPR